MQYTIEGDKISDTNHCRTADNPCKNEAYTQLGDSFKRGFCSEHENTVKTLDRVNRMMLEHQDNHKTYIQQQEDILNRLYLLEQKAGKSVAEETFWGAMDKFIISIKK